MDVAVVVGAAGLGVLLGPWMVALVDRVPEAIPVPVTLRPAPLDGADPSAHRRRDRVVRIAAPLVLAAAAARWGESLLILLPFLVLYGSLLVLSVIDIEHHRLPNRILFPTLAVCLPLIALVSLVEGFPSAVLGALTGAAVYYLLLLVPHLVYPPGMGYGDVKLALLLGLFLGWIHQTPLRAVQMVLWALIVASALGTLIGLTASVIRRKRGEFPFGPALAIGCVVVLTWSDRFLAF